MAGYDRILVGTCLRVDKDITFYLEKYIIGKKSRDVKKWLPKTTVIAMETKKKKKSSWLDNPVSPIAP